MFETKLNPKKGGKMCKFCGNCNRDGLGQVKLQHKNQHTKIWSKGASENSQLPYPWPNCKVDHGTQEGASKLGVKTKVLKKLDTNSEKNMYTKYKNQRNKQTKSLVYLYNIHSYEYYICNWKLGGQVPMGKFLKFTVSCVHMCVLFIDNFSVQAWKYFSFSYFPRIMQTFIVFHIFCNQS